MNRTSRAGRVSAKLPARRSTWRRPDRHQRREYGEHAEAEHAQRGKKRERGPDPKPRTMRPVKKICITSVIALTSRSMVAKKVVCAPGREARGHKLAWLK